MKTTKRKYLKPFEVEKIIHWLENTGRCQKRKDTQITYLQTSLFCKLAYQHGLRLNEAIALKWHDNLREVPGGTFGVTPRLMVQRLKGSAYTDQILDMALWDELKQLDQRQRQFYLENGKNVTCNWLFVSVEDPSSCVSDTTFGPVIKKALKGLDLDVYGTSHLFKHCCGIKLAETGKSQKFIQNWLGHKNFSSSEVYLEFEPKRVQVHPITGSNSLEPTRS